MSDATSGADVGGAAPDALALAFRHLSRRARTVAEVRRHLEDRGVESAAAEAAVAELEGSGYLDDAAYARRFAQDRRLLDGWGAERIAERLRGAGVEDEDVRAALEDPELGQEHDAALALLRRRLSQPPAGDRDRQRALGLLVRRGFALELAHDAVRAFEREGSAR